MKSKGAIENLEERLSRDPLSRAFLQLAEEYRKAGRYDDAVRVCMEGLSRHPTYHTARIALGKTYLEAGDLESARRALSEVLELAPENHLAAKLLAEVQRRLGDAAGAIATYRSILIHYPGDREIMALLRDLESPSAPPASAPPSASTPAPRPVATPLFVAAPSVTSAPPPAAVPPRAAQTAPRPVAAMPRPAPPVAIPAPRPVPVPPPALVPAAPASEEPSFEYRQEDLETTSRAGESGAVDQGDALQTNTLAELYLRQGMVDKAVQVYREMLRVDPRNDRARLRLRELAPEVTMPEVSRPVAVPPPASRVPEQRRMPEPRPGRSVEPAISMRTPNPAAVVERPAGRERKAIDRLERWLRTVRTQAAPRREEAPR